MSGFNVETYEATLTPEITLEGVMNVTNRNGGGGEGENGATFYPTVSQSGVISWINDKGLPNPSPVEIKGPKGDKGDKGADGASGKDGAQGPKGDKGDKGEDGTGVTILGAYDSYQELIAAHSTGNLGDAYLVQGDLYVWNGAQWQNVGNIQGPKGDKGDKGDDGTPGAQGPKGDKGDTGANGADGAQGAKGDKGDTGAAGVDGKDGANGTNGKDGIAPERGVDYWTTADVATMKSEAQAYIDAQLGVIINGSY